MPAKQSYLMDVGNNKVVVLKLVKTSITNLADNLGMTELGADGEVPAGKVKVGEGRLAALEFGCFPIAIKYSVSATKSQVAKVLCSPTKSDTIFAEAKTATYRSKNIIDVSVPKRRVYVV